MKITTIVLASALAMPSSLAFAQAGEGDANYEGNYTCPGCGGSGYSGVYGAYPRLQSYAWEPEARYPSEPEDRSEWLPPAPRRRLPHQRLYR